MHKNYEFKDIINIVNEYIKKECQVKGNLVKLDPYLTSLCKKKIKLDILGPKIKEEIEVKKDEIDLPYEELYEKED